MRIAIANIYGDAYSEDRLFHPEACKIGENLLIPDIKLKEMLESNGHQVHTIDMYKGNDFDYVIFKDLSDQWWRFIPDIGSRIKYIAKRKWKTDSFRMALKSTNCTQRLLIIQEPPVVCPAAYKTEYHQYFERILTWNDDLVDNRKYFKYFTPQPLPDSYPSVPYKEKRFLVIMCGNKSSSIKNELYSERKKVIEYFETKDEDFDLYGYGWENSNYKSYKGVSNGKLETISKYKYSICYENMCGIKGYITEKIIDCFFAGCVPIYWGAENIEDYIPVDAFIDRRLFADTADVVKHLKSLSSEQYNRYVECAKEFINSDRFKELFSVDAYVKHICKAINDAC